MITPPKIINIPKKKKLISNRVDNYYWIKDSDEKIMPYIESMNAEVDKFIDSDLIDELYREFKSRTIEDYISVPYYYNNFFYYSRLFHNKNYISLYRYSVSNNHELLLDCNILASDYKYFSLGDYDISKSNDKLLYTVDVNGDESYMLYLKYIYTDKTILADCNLCSQILWKDNNSYYYINYDSNRRPYKVCCHNLTSNLKKIVYEEYNEKFIVSIYKSKDNKYIFINSQSKTSSEIFYITKQNKCISIQKRMKNVIYTVEHNAGLFYILTNLDKFQNFKVMTTPVTNTKSSNWREIIKYKSIYITEIMMFKNYLTLNCKKNGLSEILIYDIASGQICHKINYRGINYLSFYINDYNSNSLVYTYSSVIQPNIYLKYRFDNKSISVLKEDLIDGFNPELYEIKRVKINSNNLYMTICYKKGLFKKNGKNMGYLYGYGSYGITIEYTFDKYIISLLDRGFLYIIAHVRGGGYLGYDWYLKGKLDKKKNTFNDFIEISEYLISNKFINRNNLFINGGSAGGLLVGAVINMKPYLYNSAIADVPYVDCLTTMLDEDLPLTISEYEEWGNPNFRKYYDYILSYSPIDNIKRQYYPNILITTGINDTQVGFWESIKYYAKLSNYNQNKQILIKTNIDAGHKSTSERYEFLNEMALKYAFVLMNIKNEL